MSSDQTYKDERERADKDRRDKDRRERQRRRRGEEKDAMKELSEDEKIELFGGQS